MSAPLNYLHLTKRALEASGFRFIAADYNTLLVARYKDTQVQLEHDLHRRNHPDKEPWAVLFEKCIEFLEARNKVKG